MFATNGILFNHESPVRGETFVTRKITRAAARIAMGLQDKIYLGNLDAKRDWGHAKDYVEAMWLMLQQDTPEDFVIATGTTTSVRDFVRMAFNAVGIELTFNGEGLHERGVVASIDSEKLKLLELSNGLTIGQELVAVDPNYFRPTEVDLLIGDPTKAKQKLGWTPKHDLKSLLEDMMQGDLKLMKKDKFLKDGGFNMLNYFE
jgi:GDPmannose 4,6-dehydratase